MFLNLIDSCTQALPVRRMLASKQWMQLLLGLTEPSASKLRQVLALRICRWVLPMISPTDPHDVLEGKGRQRPGHECTNYQL